MTIDNTVQHSLRFVSGNAARSGGFSLSILGIRGIPGQHGGFESFAEAFAVYLSKRNWNVRVYCQADGAREWRRDTWQGVELVHVPSRLRGPAGTVEFDMKCTWHALLHPSDVHLTLGYNTAILGLFYRLLGRCNVFNMDGLDWKRAKWSRPIRGWFYLNDWLGCWLGNRLIADHPLIARHLATRGVRRKVTMIPYGSDTIVRADEAPLARFGLQAGKYLLIVARPEPENSIAEMVAAFSAKPRGVKLAVLGRYEPKCHPYHRRVVNAASSEVVFLGPVYDKEILAALRFHAMAYCHGHRVGGTNPSLVEALGAGNPVLAHDNAFNRWVAGDAAFYFADEKQCRAAFESLIDDADRRERARSASRARHRQLFTWPQVLAAYECLLLECCGERVPEQTFEWS